MKRFLCLFLCAVTIISSQASAIEVLPDRIVTHGVEFIPRRAVGEGNNLIVPAGETVTLDDATHDYIEVSGTLTVTGSVRFIDLLVLPGGTLALEDGSEIVIRDVPLDTVADPYQWGNGIVNLGTWKTNGRPLEHTWTLAKPMAAGATEIELGDLPGGWQVGDELLIPDTRQPAYKLHAGTGLWQPDQMPRRESPVRIASINGTTITLSKPLDFEHNAAFAPDGTLRYLPYVLNITRDTVIRSDNPDGTRGHTVTTGSGTQDLRWAAFLGLGRTRAENLHSTTYDSHTKTFAQIGTNQVGRYPVHWHHNHPDHSDPTHPHGGHSVGLYIDGDDTSKWGNVVHGTNGIHVADLIAYRCVGSGLVTEDGNEFDFVFERCFVVGSNGAADLAGAPTASKFLMVAPRNNPGGEGSGIWLHSTQGTVRNCVSANNAIGINAFHFKQVPSTERTNLPVEFSGNVAFGNRIVGFETWTIHRNQALSRLWTAKNLTCWHNGQSQVRFGNGEVTEIRLENPQLLSQDADYRVWGIQNDTAYHPHIEVAGGRVEGCDVGVQSAKRALHLTDGLVMQNHLNVDLRRQIPAELTLDFVCLQMPGVTEPQPCVLANEPIPVPTPDPQPEPEPEPTWSPANIGPPFNGDVKLRVRNGVLERQD